MKATVTSTTAEPADSASNSMAASCDAFRQDDRRREPGGKLIEAGVGDHDPENETEWRAGHGERDHLSKSGGERPPVEREVSHRPEATAI